MQEDMLEALERIESALRAILMLQIRRAQGADEGSRAKPRSLESLLFEAGITSQTGIGRIVNKTRQSVNQRLKGEGTT